MLLVFVLRLVISFLSSRQQVEVARIDDCPRAFSESNVHLAALDVSCWGGNC